MIGFGNKMYELAEDIESGKRFKKKPVGTPMWICFDGPDRTGKTTQLNLLAQAFIDSEWDVFTIDTKEWPHSNAFREMLESGEAKADKLLYRFFRTAEMYWMQQQILSYKPPQGKRSVIISGRWVWSSIAYESGPDGLPLDFILNLHSHICIPDITLILFNDDNLTREKMDTFDCDIPYQQYVTDRFKYMCSGLWELLYDIDCTGFDRVGVHSLVLEKIREFGVNVGYSEEE